MSSGITATNLANINYSSYAYANSANGKKYATSKAGAAKNDFNVSNLTNALSSLDFCPDNDGITTVDAYAKAHYLTSQTSVYNGASDSVDFSTLSGTASSYAKTAYTAQKKDLYSSSAVNLYSIINASSSARSAYQTAALNSKYSSGSSAIGAYGKYLSTSAYSSGNFLSTVA